jgi:hypothetical protein
MDSNFKNNKIEKKDIKKEDYLDLVNDFGLFITLNASKIEQQVKPGNENLVAEVRQALRAPIINGLNYSDFIAKYGNRLLEPEISKTIISQIYNFLNYLQPRMNLFKDGEKWPERFRVISEKYKKVVQP